MCLAICGAPCTARRFRFSLWPRALSSFGSLIAWPLRLDESANPSMYSHCALVSWTQLQRAASTFPRLLLLGQLALPMHRPGCIRCKFLAFPVGSSKDLPPQSWSPARKGTLKRNERGQGYAYTVATGKPFKADVVLQKRRAAESYAVPSGHTAGNVQEERFSEDSLLH